MLTFLLTVPKSEVVTAKLYMAHLLALSSLFSEIICDLGTQ